MGSRDAGECTFKKMGSGVRCLAILLAYETVPFGGCERCINDSLYGAGILYGFLERMQGEASFFLLRDLN